MTKILTSRADLQTDIADLEAALLKIQELASAGDIDGIKRVVAETLEWLESLKDDDGEI